MPPITSSVDDDEAWLPQFDDDDDDGAVSDKIYKYFSR